ncbi:MAG: MaoC/PaaZ C-terminal domain-containing protein [Candidatus Binataceae bacterium]
MPLDSSIVGAAGDFLSSEIDARWTMAYAAGLGDVLPCYMDTRAGIIAHPMFPVCFEWAAIIAMRDVFERSGLTPDEARRGVHASHDLIIHRAIRPPERLRTKATFAGVEQRKPGAYQVTKLETVDDAGAPVCTSWYGAIYREVAIKGPDRFVEKPPQVPAPRTVPARPRAEITIPVSAGLAHVYTECARIFNPIHTDAAVAHSAGLPSIILHGTATHALAVSQIVATEAKREPRRVRRIGGRFGAMVPMPSEIRLRIHAREDADDATNIFFDVLNAEGGPAIRDGFVSLS